MDFISIAQAAEEIAQKAANSPVGVLGLEAKLFIGQLVNFAILLFVFWKWILPNIVKGLQSRKERIEKSLLDAEKVEKEKLEFAKWKNEEINKAKKEASNILAQVNTETTQ